MTDAESIEIVSSVTTGTGTVMLVETVVGPFRTTDVMVVTGWEQMESITVAHVGLVTGEGTFSLRDSDLGTEFEWSEELSFPWILGGPITATFAAPILRSIWSRNLKRFADSFSG